MGKKFKQCAHARTLCVLQASRNWRASKLRCHRGYAHARIYIVIAVRGGGGGGAG